jgi:hypothetical protein
VRVRPGDKVGREQLVHYVTRPPFAEDQRQLLDEERVRLELRRPLRSGQTEIILHPLALLRRLVWLVPPPRHCPRGGSKEPHRRAYSGADARGGGSVIVPPDPIRPSPRPQRKFRPAVVLAGRISVQRMFALDRPPLRAPDPRTLPRGLGPAPRPSVRRPRLRLPGLPRKAQAGGRSPVPSRRNLAQDQPHLPRRRPGPTDGPALPRLAGGELTQGLSPVPARASTRRPRPLSSPAPRSSIRTHQPLPSGAPLSPMRSPSTPPSQSGGAA